MFPLVWLCFIALEIRKFIYLYIFSHFTSNTNTNLRPIKFDVYI